MSTSNSAPTVSSEKGTGFRVIDEMMAQTRTKYATNPALRPKIDPPPALAPTPEAMDFNEHLDGAYTKSETLAAEAQAQFAAPRIAPTELTPAEQAEKTGNERWDQGYRAADQLTDEMLERNEKVEWLKDVPQEVRERVKVSKEPFGEYGNAEVKLCPIQGRAANASNGEKKRMQDQAGTFIRRVRKRG